MAVFLSLLLLTIVAVFGKMTYTYLRQEQEKVIKPKNIYDETWNEFVDNKKTKKSTQTKYIQFAIIGGLLFLLVGYLIILTLGFFESWQKVTKTTEYIFSARDGENFGGAGWIRRPCDYSSPRFSKLPISPGTVVDCVETYQYYGLWRVTYVRDVNGNTWKWPNDRFILISILLLAFSALASEYGLLPLVLLLLLSIIIVVWFVKKRFFSARPSP